MLKSQCEFLWSRKDQPHSASVLQSWIWERVNPLYPLNGVDQVGSRSEFSKGRRDLYRCLVKETLLGCIRVLARELQSDSTWERLEEEGEEWPNKTPPYTVYLDSIRTPSGYANDFCLVCLAACSHCISVRVLPWCWSHVYCTTPKGPYCLSFPSVGAAACVYCKTCHHPLFA